MKTKEIIINKEPEFIISSQLANQILQYLITKPFIEVHQMILGLQQLKQVESGTDLGNVEDLSPPVTTP